MNEPEQWIVIPNWKKFQHYGNRRSVPWIKVYNELNSRAEWLDLTLAERGLLITIWIEYARSKGTLKASSVHRLSPTKTRRKHWESLNRAGFIQFRVSAPRALARVDAEKEQVPAREARYELEKIGALLEQAGRPVENSEEPWN